MAIMAAQVGLDQMLGDNGRLGWRTAARRDDAVGKRTQPDVVNKGPAEFAGLLDEEIVFWRKVVEETGVKVN